MPPRYTLTPWKNGRHWAVHNPDGTLLCVTVYKRGAIAVITALGGIVV